MKKYLIVLAAAVIALASCNKKEDTYTSISFKEANRTMIYGEQAQFSLLWEPATLAEPACTWESSDTTVLKVDETGIVTAVYVGEANIIAKYNDLSAVCHVTVETYEEAWGLSEIYYFPSSISENPLNDSIYIKESSSGNQYECRLHSLTIVALNSVEFESAIGEGDCVMGTVSALIITKAPAGYEQNVGHAWDYDFKIFEDSARFIEGPNCAFPGKIDPAIIGPAVQHVYESLAAEENPDVDKFIEEYTPGVSGMGIVNLKSTAEGITYSPFYDGIVTRGEVTDKYDAENDSYYTDYDIDVQWCGYTPGLGYFGLAWDKNAESYDELLIQPYELYLSDVWNYRTNAKGVNKGSANISARAPRAPKHIGPRVHTTEKLVPFVICNDKPKAAIVNK